MLRSLDTETTGLDLKHSSRPHFITTCDENGDILFYQWEVDPYTRRPRIPPGDLDEVEELIASSSLLVLQNSKFDVRVLGTVRPRIMLEWPWDKTEDTLIAAHLLASNKSHNLTALGVRYLHRSIEKYETRLTHITNEARRYARSHFPKWRIARGGMDDLPSAYSGSLVANDYWLPRMIAIEEGRPEPDENCDHSWNRSWDDKERICSVCGGDIYWVALRDYGNMDSDLTAKLWPIMKARIEMRRLGAIYREKMKLLPILVKMEERGITQSGENMEELRTQYVAESKEAGEKCVAIARGYKTATEDGKLAPYELSLPRTGNNGSLVDFVFNVMKLPVRKRTKTGAPCLDKYVLEDYEATLDGEPLDFVRALRGKRKRDVALTYMDAYQRFSRGINNYPEYRYKVPTLFVDWHVLHPGLNPTGTDTLRLSSSNPNEQNISKQGMPCMFCSGEGCGECGGKGIDPKSLRYAFGPAPGREWYSFDAKNIELRIPFWESGEEELMDLFNRPKDPPYYGSNHLLNFATVYPDIWEAELGTICDNEHCCKGKKVTLDNVGPHVKKKFAASWYQFCKNGGFAKQYGAQRPKTDGTFRRQGAYDLLDGRFKKLAKHNQWCIDYARKWGYVETLPDKTVDPRRGYPLLCSRMENNHILPTVPLNYRTQGTACWVMMRMMIKVQEYLDILNKAYPGRGYYLVMQIHDEIVVDFPRDPERNRSKVFRIKELMDMVGYDLIPAIPLPVGIEYHPNNWAEGETLA